MNLMKKQQMTEKLIVTKVSYKIKLKENSKSTTEVKS